MSRSLFSLSKQWGISSATIQARVLCSLLAAIFDIYKTQLGTDDGSWGGVIICIIIIVIGFFGVYFSLSNVRVTIFFRIIDMVGSNWSNITFIWVYH